MTARKRRPAKAKPSRSSARAEQPGKLMLGLPKGSLEKPTFDLLSKAGYSVSGSSRSYRPSIDDPELAEFVARFEDINALADDAPGFVWRLQTDDGDATGIDYFGTDALVNMSVWKDIESLHGYVYHSAHIEVMALRKQWFERMIESYSVLWWIGEGQLPTLARISHHLVYCDDAMRHPT